VRLTAEPVSSAAFADAMAAFAPFEPNPTVAVGVSGGPDSLALTLLLHGWAQARNGSMLALTVDHGLRPEAAAEARQVAAWLGTRGIAHRILAWTGDKPDTGIQAAARRARYDLLAAAAAEHGILHLAIAHHADDQAETILFRKDRGSGPEGLAGMSAARSLGAVRLIRPLLGWTKASLVATCAAYVQPFVEDPSNRSADYARPVLRKRLAGDPVLRRSLLQTARNAAETRMQLGKRVASLLGQIATIGPDGIGHFDRAGLAGAPPATRRAALSAILRTIGGNAFAPDDAALDRLDKALESLAFRGMSLAGCLVRPWRGGLLICREAARIAAPVPLEPGRWTRWDDRFELRARIPGLAVGALGSERFEMARKSTIPAAARAGFPAARNNGALAAVPALGWQVAEAAILEQRLTPLWPLASETFTVVSAGPDIMSDRN
jgi:tRNA(Ile)-lysidine synthase